MKLLWKMKVLGVLAGRKEEFLRGATAARPCSNIEENARFEASGPLSGPSRPMPHPGASSRTLPAWSQGPEVRAGNLLTRPIGPNRPVLQGKRPGRVRIFFRSESPYAVRSALKSAAGGARNGNSHSRARSRFHRFQPGPPYKARRLP